jgi:SPP1 gp7 family putative phage head morphogenesis protein
MLGAIARGIGAIARGIANIARRIGGRTKTRLREQEEKPERRTYRLNAIRDSKTCKLCRDKDGTTFVVSSDDSVEDIAARMSSVVPPIHINCRCTLEKVGIFRGVI